MQIREGMQAQITSLEEELKKPVRKLCYNYSVRMYVCVYVCY